MKLSLGDPMQLTPNGEVARKVPRGFYTFQRTQSVDRLRDRFKLRTVKQQIALLARQFLWNEKQLHDQRLQFPSVNGEPRQRERRPYCCFPWIDRKEPFGRGLTPRLQSVNGPNHLKKGRVVRSGEHLS
jgi:hypothetical protein